MTDASAEFLAGERPDDVALFLSEHVLDDPGPLLEYGERVERDGEPAGVLLVMDGETGRSVFQSATEMDAMAFAGKAMRTEGEVDPDLTGGSCPKAGTDHGDDEASAGAAGEAEQSTDASDAGQSADAAHDAGEPADHAVRFVFAFAEEQNPEVGGRYEEGDVVHAYAHCTCGAAYAQQWTVGDRPIPE